MRFGLLLSFFAFTSSIFAQDINFECATFFGPTTDSEAGSIELNADGSVVLCGLHGDEGLIAKRNTDCSSNWYNILFTDGACEVKDVCLDNAGNVYATGYMFGTTDFDSSPEVYELEADGNFDSFVMKLNSEGELQWVHSFGGTSTDQAFAIDLLNSGDLVLTGRFEETVDFDFGPESSTLVADGREGFILRITPDAEFVWVKRIEGDGITSSATELSIDSNDNITIAGSYNGQTDLDPGAGTHLVETNGGTDAYVVQLDETGDFVWGGVLTSTSTMVIRDLDYDSNDNLVVTGNFGGLMDAELTANGEEITATNISDVFICKYQNDGSFLWGHPVGHMGTDIGYQVSVGDEDQVYVAGVFGGIVDFDHGPEEFDLNAEDVADPFLLLLASDGSFLNAFEWGGASTESLQGMDYKSGTLVTSGRSRLDADLDPTPDGSFIASLSGTYRIWTNRMSTSDCMTTSNTITVETCDSYTSGSGQVYDLSGTFTEFLTNAEGCDSILTIDLTISMDVFSNVMYSACDSLDYAGNWYYESIDLEEIYEGASAQGCDSIVTVSISISYSESSSTNAVICEGDSFLFHDQELSQAGVYEWEYQTPSGCDGIEILTLSFYEPAQGILELASCDSLNYGGSWYLESTSFEQLHPGASVNGCDSTTLVIIEITDVLVGEQTLTGCNEVVYNDIVYVESTTVEENFPGGSVSGCDSMHLTTIEITHIDLTISEVPDAGISAPEQEGVSYQWVDCNNNFEPIEDATESFFIPSEAGLYAFIATSGDCELTSDCIKGFPVGTFELLLEGVSLFPNPATDRLVIRQEDIGFISSIQILDVQGRVLVHETLLPVLVHEISLNLAPGHYLVRFNETSGLSVPLVVR